MVYNNGVFLTLRKPPLLYNILDELPSGNFVYFIARSVQNISDLFIFSEYLMLQGFSLISILF